MALRNDISEVASVLDAVEAFGEENRLPRKKIFQLNLVLDELITNIVSYGFEDSAESSIRLSVALGDGTIDVELTDNGRPFDPVAAPLPELGGSIEERQVGGLGLKFMRTYMDRLDYRRDGEFNRLRLQMNLGAADRQAAGDA
jgi:serine/threonine-protein kinase RsbW